jgi:hypothetical protein
MALCQQQVTRRLGWALINFYALLGFQGTINREAFAAKFGFLALFAMDDKHAPGISDAGRAGVMAGLESDFNPLSCQP